MFFISAHSNAQHRGKSNYSKNNRSYYKNRYAASTKSANSQCFKLYKKKQRKHNKKVAVASNKSQHTRPQAEVDINDTPPKKKPATKPIAKAKVEPDVDKLNLNEKHAVEDDVLKKNSLPAPTSTKHEQIRKNVESHLAKLDDQNPIKLEPLYFVSGQDEFAFVDMDPFLIAVEYALQGKMILIEGHTDHVGDYKANVELSIKRVEKIRQLMMDMGVHDDKISVVGYGEELSEQVIETDKKQNERRVDFTVF
jgi:outer membrane protein OmpA-like peptidoglycan-associated protein